MKNVEGVFIVTIQGLTIGLLIVLVEKLLSVISLSRRSKISLWGTFKHEMKCYVDFDNNSKPVLRGEEEDSSGEAYEQFSKWIRLICSLQLDTSQFLFKPPNVLNAEIANIKMWKYEKSLIKYPNKFLIE